MLIKIAGYKNILDLDSCVKNQRGYTEVKHVSYKNAIYLSELLSCSERRMQTLFHRIVAGPLVTNSNLIAVLNSPN